MKSFKSLPPLVEGKISSYLRLTVDRVLWSDRSDRTRGGISVFATWWGESNSARFRPVDITRDDKASKDEITQVYAIRTNTALFKDYLRNSESVKLVVLADETDTLVGLARITELENIFTSQTFKTFVPVVSPNGNTIGQIQVSLCLLLLTELTPDFDINVFHCETGGNNDGTTNLRYKSKHNKQTRYEDSWRRSKDSPSGSSRTEAIVNGHRFALNERYAEFSEPLLPDSKSISSDQLLARVVARAKLLREALLSEACDQSSLHLSDKTNELCAKATLKTDKSLPDYYRGEELAFYEKWNALTKPRPVSPVHSRLMLPGTGIEDSCLEDFSSEIFAMRKGIELTQSHRNSIKEGLPVSDYDNARIDIDSFRLSSAGYRRVKSSFLSSGYSDFPLPVTYLIHCGIDLERREQSRKLESNPKEKRFIRISSKREMDQAIYFGYKGIYKFPECTSYRDSALIFKLYIRHPKKKAASIELGSGSICLKNLVKTDSQTKEQCVAVIKKGIKVGELSVRVELLDSALKTVLDACTGPIRENLSPLREEYSWENKENQENNESESGTAGSGRRIDVGTNHFSVETNSAQFITEGNASRRRKSAAVRHDELKSEAKILLHCLIHIVEAKNLSAFNSYIVCRTCWREERFTSSICEKTENPKYHFRQLVPLVYDSDLFKHMKENHVIVEVHSRGSDTESLLGLAKLPVDRFSVSLGNPPDALDHRLLESKTAVISVDGWIPIVNPVTGQSAGQLLALLALGTAEQIRFFESTRGTKSMDESVFRKAGASEPSSSAAVLHTQEMQTDISSSSPSTVDKIQGDINFGCETLQKLIGQLGSVLTVNRSQVDQAAQTETSFPGSEAAGHAEIEAPNGGGFYAGAVRDYDQRNSFKNKFSPLPSDESWRSVGVGAEYDADVSGVHHDHDHDHDHDIPIKGLSLVSRIAADDTDCGEKNRNSFRAIVEIEGALHLPKLRVESGEIVEPSTYVTFHAENCRFTNRANTSIITEVVRHSCNPKWNWKADVRLPTELLVNNGKRLILKIWRLYHTADAALPIDSNRDVIIGFAAVDLTILTAGLSMVSGWFHIMDYSGKCNGQIQVNVTALDNFSPFTKCTGNSSEHGMPNSMGIPPSNREAELLKSTEGNTGCVPANINSASTCSSAMPTVPQLFDCEVPASCLSLSLKQKLAELDEITKRLQSRLYDVTSTAFLDDFEQELELIESSGNIENKGDITGADLKATTTSPPIEQEHSMSGDELPLENRNRSDSDGNRINIHSSIGSPVNYPCGENGNICPKLTVATMENRQDYRERGEKVHINHLLEKLSFRPDMYALSTNRSLPLRGNVIDLLENLQQNNRQNNNLVQQQYQSMRDITVRRLPVHGNSDDGRNIGPASFPETSDDFLPIDKPDPQVPVKLPCKGSKKLSDVVREELMAEENSNGSKPDELSTYLLTSNVQHTNFDEASNASLLYHELTLARNTSDPTASADADAVKRLDHRYTTIFGAFNEERLQDTTRHAQQVSTRERLTPQENISYNKNGFAMENHDISPLTLSSLSEDSSGCVDVTVVQRTSYDDSMSDNKEIQTTESSRLGKKICASQLNVDLKPPKQPDSHSSVSETSRQAPEGGNPMEDGKNLQIRQQQSNDCQIPFVNS